MKKKSKVSPSLHDRVDTLGGEVVRFDAPRHWVDQVIEAADLTSDMSDEEITFAVEEWAKYRGCYADPEGE